MVVWRSEEGLNCAGKDSTLKVANDLGGVISPPYQSLKLCFIVRHIPVPVLTLEVYFELDKTQSNNQRYSEQSTMALIPKYRRYPFAQSVFRI